MNELKETIKTLQNNPLIKSGAYEFIGDSNVTYAEIYILLEHIKTLQQENQSLKDRIEKAIEHCKIYNIYVPMYDNQFTRTSKILEILKGDK